MNQESVVKRIRSGWALHYNIKSNRFELKKDSASIIVMPKVGKPTLLYLNGLLHEEKIDENNFVYVIKNQNIL